MGLTRADRAALAKRAGQVRQQGQRDGWDVATIAAEICRQVPELLPLEAWRLAYGWSRPQVVEAVGEVFRADGLASPGLSVARLCKWEHGQARPDVAYTQALVRVYRASEQDLGLARAPRSAVSTGYGRDTASLMPASSPGGLIMPAAPDPQLTAVADSIDLHRELEGPAGGVETRVQVERAVVYYSMNYGKWPPHVIAGEIHRCRSIVVDMLKHVRDERVRTELRRLAGWLSGLLGNLAFHASDYSGAHIHLGTGARLGADVGEPELACWSLGAQAMVATFEERPAEARELSAQAMEYATTPLRQAQITAWCELRAVSELGDRAETERALSRSVDYMDAAEPEAGRFGFDRSEMFQHIAESALTLGDATRARDYADAARGMKTLGTGGWAATTAVMARAHAAQRDADGAVALAGSVLDEIPAERLRETTRRRLAKLDVELNDTGEHPPRVAREFRERLRAVPAHTPASRSSPEPNGH